MRLILALAFVVSAALPSPAKGGLTAPPPTADPEPLPVHSAELSSDAYAAYLDGDFKKAYRLWYGHAQKDDVKSQTWVGLLLFRGEGVAENKKRAFVWFRRAALKGNTEAMVNLGLMRFEGIGVKKDERKAYQWIRKAARKGDPEGQMNLATLFEKGKGTKKNIPRALGWYEKACDKDNLEACRSLARMHGTGVGVKVDAAQAYYWFYRAALLGDEDAAARRDKLYDNMKTKQRKAAHSLIKAYTQSADKKPAGK